MFVFEVILISSVHHRYSTLRQFHTSVESSLPRGFPAFPPKQFGSKSNFDPDSLKKRCVGLNVFFNSLLQCESIRSTPSFQALFVPEGDVMENPTMEPSEEETEEEALPEDPVSMEDRSQYRRLQLLESQLFCFVNDFLQIDSTGGLYGNLHYLLEKSVFGNEMILRMAHILNGGSLFKYYQRLEHDFISPTNIAFLLGCLRIHSYSNEEWYLENLSSLSGDASYSQYSSEENNEMSQARSALLSEFPDELFKFLEKFDSIATIRLSLLRIFEQFQDPLFCKNVCLHLLDITISTFFPTIEVWSHLVESPEEEDE